MVCAPINQPNLPLARSAEAFERVSREDKVSEAIDIYEEDFVREDRCPSEFRNRLRMQRNRSIRHAS